ncbi:MAG: WecB/TagA/CpsF family glycosyltransferase [Ilumatobacteraceae bacterium]
MEFPVERIGVADVKRVDSSDATPVRCVNIFGVDVDAVDMAGAVELARDAVLSGRPHQHVVLNAAKIVAMHDDKELARIIKGCDFILADGAPIVWFAHLAGRRLPERVAGADLFEELVATAAADGHAVYFLGAQQHVVDRVVKVFRDRHPTLKVAGWHDGFWTSDDEVIELIRQAQPHYLFLAIPSPRKEYWLNANLDRLLVPFSMGVGGSFDVVAGEITRAPRWMQRIGMEWSWRLIKEPRRMFKRYLVGNTRFIILAGRELRSARRGSAVG